MIDTTNISQLYLPVLIMKPLLVLIVFSALIYFVMVVIRDKEFEDEQIFLYFVKFLAYGAFAYIIFIFYKNKNFIDITTFFTFVFCSAEAAHNFVPSVGAFFIYLWKLSFKMGIVSVIILLLVFNNIPWNIMNNSIEQRLYEIIEKEKNHLK